MFDRYARAGRSLQVQTKGNYWAGRAALAAGQFQKANNYFQRAAAYPELFYGQLALERLGRSVTPPPQALPQYVTTAAQRAASTAGRWSRRCGCSASRAARPSRRCSSGRSPNRSTTTPTATSPSSSASRSAARTLPVWTARMARVKGSMFYVRQAYPTLPASVSGEPVVARPRHQPAGKLVRPLCGQPRRRARHDAADDRNGARAGRQDGRRLRQLPADQRPQLQRDARLGLLPADAQHLGRQRSARGRELQRRLAAMSASGSTPMAIRAARSTCSSGSRRSPTSRPRAYVQRVIENSVVYDSLRGRAAAAIGDARLALSWERAARADSRRAWPTRRPASSRPKASRGSAPNMTSCSGSSGRRSSKSSPGPRRSATARKMPITSTASKRLREIDRRLVASRRGS